MDFEEFCAAALSVHQLEALDRWEQHARCAYELFEKEGNRPIMIDELASVCLFLSNLTPSLYEKTSFKSLKMLKLTRWLKLISGTWSWSFCTGSRSASRLA